MDCDLICRTSLYDLYMMPFGKYYVLGVEDILVEDNVQRLNLEKYINSGVMLINLSAWRAENIEEKFINYMHECVDKILYHDQDVLNSVLATSIDYIDSKWNAQTSSYISYVQGLQNSIGLKSNIVHFISDRKPWKNNSNSPFEFEFTKYNSLVKVERKKYFKSILKNTHNKPEIENDGINEYQLACDYRDGNGVDRDLILSAQYFRSACKFNQLWNWELFDVLWTINTECTDEEMIALARKYAENNPHAMGRLGRAYKCGRGVEKDKNVAIEWFTKAAAIDDFWKKELDEVKMDDS